MRLIASILTLSLSTHALAFALALAAPIKRSERATPTITKTVYHTEVWRLSTSFKDHDVRSESVVSDPSTFIFNDEVFEDVHDDTASPMATVFLWPRGPSGQKPTISQLPVIGVPVSFNGRQVGFVHLDNDTERDEALHSRPNTVDRRNTDLYHINIDLASEGYISVFMSNSTASAFCTSEVELGSEGGPKGDLQLAVRNSTKTVAIPVHQEAAASFCLHLKNAEAVDSPASGKVPGSATATFSDSERKTSDNTPNETTFESVSKTSKHAYTADTASRTEADASASATSATSTSKTTTLNTFDITNEIRTSKSTKHIPAEATASESGSATLDDGTDKTVSKTSEADDSSSGGNTTKSKKHKFMSVTASESDLATSETATNVSSKHKTKFTASEADEDASKTVEASTTPTISKAANADSSELEESASHSAKAKSKTSETNETEDNAESVTSIQEYRGPAADPTDSDAFSTPKATPAAMPVSTTTDGPFTEASINSFYSYIRSFVETPPDPSSNIGSTDQTSIITTDSSNGAVRRGILIAPTAALIAIRAETDRHSLGNSMIYTSEYSWKGTVPTAIASATASSNAATGRLKPPYLLWHRWYPTTTTKSVFSRKRNSGLDEEPEQEDEGFFKIDVEDQEPTGVSVDVSRVEEETAVATKLAHKQEDNDEDDEGTDAKVGSKNKENGENVPVDEETTPDKEVQTDEGAAGDDETTTSTSTNSKSSHTKTAVDEEDTSAPTATASEDVGEKATSTKKRPADDVDEVTPTVTSSKDFKDKASSTKTKHAENDDEKATPTSKPTDDTPPEDEDTPSTINDKDTQDDISTSDETSTTTSHKAKSTKSAISDSDDDADEEPATTTKSTHKSKVTIPSLASGVSFAFPSITNTAMNSMTPPLLTPPPAPTGTAPMPVPTQPIIWDPDCPQISTSTLTAPDGVTTALPMTVGLGCWRSLPAVGGSGNDTMTGGANGHMMKSKAWKILSDRQNLQLGVVCWMVIGLIGFQ